jgi:hypothetical protein
MIATAVELLYHGLGMLSVVHRQGLGAGKRMSRHRLHLHLWCLKTQALAGEEALGRTGWLLLLG